MASLSGSYQNSVNRQQILDVSALQKVQATTGLKQQQGMSGLAISDADKVFKDLKQNIMNGTSTPRLNKFFRRHKDSELASV